ncbi:MAG TPA: CAP domain-containing protein, partial [Thermohalobaculum sp.]|nr:CAP domain-containing protein [Thermohalobaculum sp.]
PAPAAAFQSGATSCPGGADPRFDLPLTPATLDPALMDRAIRSHTNRERCDAGLAPLAAAPPLARAAAMQAGDMAAAATVAPVLPADPDKTLDRRYFLAGASPHRQRGEILMQIALESPGVARVRSRAPRCDFPVAGPGSALTPTHGSVARRLVDAWMASEGMRATLMSPDWTEAGAAVAIRPVEGTCGDVYAAESFAKR